MIYVSFEEAVAAMRRGLERYLPEDAAQEVAEIFAGNSFDGVHSHGMNRYPRVVAEMGNGICDPTVLAAERVSGFGALEVLDAHFGVGPLIARQASRRAMELAAQHGVACVAVRNNSHWLRAGRYALEMADAGYAGICFTNTCMNLAAWGTHTFSTGNNPIAMSIPRKKGSLIMDMAISQYAYGKLEVMAQQGKMLDTPCGYDSEGNETCDPAKIVNGGAMYPMAMWKGNALSVMLDLMAVVLSGGRSSLEIGAPADGERGMSQVFIAIRPEALGDLGDVEEKMEKTIAFLHSLETEAGRGVHAPGENLEATREKHRREGIPVTEETWAKILAAGNWQ